jgi:hypothetical protein
MIQYNAGQTARLELLGFVEGVSNPEDLVDLPDSSWIVVSGMRSARHPGRLFVVDAEQPGRARQLRWTSGAEAARVSAEVFDPHGIAVRPLGHRRYELLVVDHGGGEAIDRLTLEIGDNGPVAVAGDRIVQPAGTSANAVAHLPDGGFVMTSMFDPTDPDRLSKFAAAEKTGQVWRWSPDHGWSRFGGLELSGANGIAASSDGSTVAFKVVRLDPANLEIVPLITVDEAQAAELEFGGATGALGVRNAIWVGSFTGERIAIFAGCP